MVFIPFEKSKVALISRSILQMDFFISIAIFWVCSSLLLSKLDVSRDIEPTGLRISCARCADTCPIEARRS